MDKVCSKCKEPKDIGQFNKSSKSKDGLHAYCRQCNSLINKEWYGSNSEKVKTAAVRWSKNNKQRSTEITRKYRESNTDRLKDAYLRRKYGISLIQYNSLLAKQAHSCAICKRSKSEFKYDLDVDHDHINDQVRGLLCNPCNQALGLLKESINSCQNMAQYLSLHKES
jgi:hypothetical protein